eukprot:Nk52_evm1s1926 gene=Nk52_evmTU1s1926
MGYSILSSFSSSDSSKTIPSSTDFQFSSFSEFLSTNAFEIFMYGLFCAWIGFIINELMYIRNTFEFARSNSPAKTSNEDDLRHSETNRRKTSVPGVSIFKPLKGLTERLEENLESFFNIDYPKYEILFAVADEDDPVIPLVDKLMRKYPNHDAHLLVGKDDIGVNPKICNVIKCYRVLKYDFLWICDANIVTYPQVLGAMMRKILGDDRVGIVHQTPIVKAPLGMGGIIEWIYFSTQHARIYFAAFVSGAACVNGMSNLIRKAYLDEIGGLDPYAKYIAEDYFMSLALDRKGYKLVLSEYCAAQNIGQQTFESFYNRQLRWLRLRKTMMPYQTIVEPFAETMVNGAAGAFSCWYLFGFNPYLVLFCHILLFGLIDFTMHNHIAHAISDPGTRFFNFFAVWLLRECIAVPLWLHGMSGNAVRWRHQDFIVHHNGLSEVMRERGFLTRLLKSVTAFSVVRSTFISTCEFIIYIVYRSQRNGAGDIDEEGVRNNSSLAARASPRSTTPSSRSGSASTKNMSLLDRVDVQVCFGVLVLVVSVGLGVVTR